MDFDFFFEKTETVMADSFKSKTDLMDWKRPYEIPKKSFLMISRIRVSKSAEINAISNLKRMLKTQRIL
jgi:hypothetical protein